MPKKGGGKKGGGSKQKSQQSQGTRPASNVKSGAVGISQKHASKIRELVVVCPCCLLCEHGVNARLVPKS